MSLRHKLAQISILCALNCLVVVVYGRYVALSDQKVHGKYPNHSYSFNETGTQSSTHCILMFHGSFLKMYTFGEDLLAMIYVPV